LDKRRERKISLSGCLKNNRQKYFKYFRLGILKLEKCNGLLPRDNQKKTQWRCSITTEETLALTFMLVHILYNLSSPSLEQLNTSQKAAAFW
jgi:hypothetical protein